MATAFQFQYEPGALVGKWTVLGLERPDGSTRSLYRCRCKCGRIKMVEPQNLVEGKSLGCIDCRNAERKANRKDPKRIVRIPCKKCGNVREIQRSNMSRSDFCQGCTRHRFPQKYPVLLETVGERLGISRQAVQYQIKSRGWDFVYARYTGAKAS